MEAAIAYLAAGSLYVIRPGRTPQPVESRFVRDMTDREARDRQRNDWKNRNAVWNVMNAPAGLNAMGMPGMASLEDAKRFRFVGAAPAPTPGEMFYTIQSPTVGGLFQFNIDSEDERRLIHRNDFVICDLGAGHDGRIACSLAYSDGSVNLGLMESDGRRLQEITEGDSIDEAPSWAGGDGNRIVYQSAGIARNSHGIQYALSPYRIELLDLDRPEVRTLAEDDAFDHLQPRMLADGSLLFIRRPYLARGRERPRPTTVIADILLFPFRLGRAFIHFFNSFSMFFSGKPLMTAGGPPKPEVDQRYMMVYGRMLDLHRAEKELARRRPGALVPKDWELVRRDPAGAETVLASHVLAFDHAADGAIVHTDGSTVHLITSSGETRELCRGKLIERLIVLPT